MGKVFPVCKTPGAANHAEIAPKNFFLLAKRPGRQIMQKSRPKFFSCMQNARGEKSCRNRAQNFFPVSKTPGADFFADFPPGAFFLREKLKKGGLQPENTLHAKLPHTFCFTPLISQHYCLPLLSSLSIPHKCLIYFPS